MLLSRANLLTQYLAAYADQRWDWASANCCHFAARWVHAISGRNPMDGLAPTPDARAARRLVRALGGLEAAWTSQLGAAPMAPAMAQLGDVVMMPTPAALPGGEGVGHLVGICTGRTAVFRADGAMVFLPVLDCTAAWRVAR